MYADMVTRPSTTLLPCSGPTTPGHRSAERSHHIFLRVLYRAAADSAWPTSRLCTTGSPIDRGAEEDEVGPQHGLHQGQRNGSSLIDDQQLCLAQALVVLRLDVLHRLQVNKHYEAYDQDVHFFFFTCSLFCSLIPSMKAVRHFCQTSG